MAKLLIGIVAVAAVATLGDYVWYEFGVQHQMAVGILHGAALLMAAGGALGWPSGRLVTGMGIGIAAGVLGALSYYALLSTLGRLTMLAAWAAVWIFLAVGEGRFIHRKPWSKVLMSGLIAAALSGLAFYAVSGLVWGRAPLGGRNYGRHFACWLVAWAPGLLAISASRLR